jgi:acetyl-CoA synthetase
MTDQAMQDILPSTDPQLAAEKAQALADPAAYWAKAAEQLHWHQPWETVKDTSFAQGNVHIRWFEGGMLNVAENCLDRHVLHQPDHPAIIWEPDDPHASSRTLTYADLHAEVTLCAAMLKKLGVQPGDRVTIYMPMVPEAAIAMLACARIGAVHSVVFGGFSAKALRDRVEDCQSRIIITADGGMRGGKATPLKPKVDEALAGLEIDHVLVLQHTQQEVNWQEGRDIWWHELADGLDPDFHIEPFSAEHSLFILYTSGSTGKPKGLLHSSAGYLLYAMHSFQNSFNYQPGEVFWCSADVGWITGHSYIVYGPLAAGATTLMFEGVPTWPDASRFWQIIDKYQVNIFYTAPTAIRMLMREGDGYLQNSTRKSLRVLGSVGEPINPEAWHWYHDQVGKGRCHVVDTWWQTETGGHMITPLAGRHPTPAGSATQPYFGIKPAILSAEGEVLEGAAEGALCIQDSWPGQARTIWGDHDRFMATYFAPFPGYYFSGDTARRDDDGNYWIKGRMDDVMNIGGHRLGTAEIEAAINEHPHVAESAVVGIADAVKGQAIYSFIILKPSVTMDEELANAINQLVRKLVGPIASLKAIQDVPGLPKTRSGKIIRRILRKIAAGEVTSPNDFEKLGDISTLVNPEQLEAIVAGRIAVG